MLAARITLPHFSVSSAISLPNSAGDSVREVPPTSASCASILGLASAAFISLLSLSTISEGMFFGAPIPNHVDACHHLEQFAGHVRCAAISDRRVVEFARIGLRMGCELQKGRRWKKWVQH